MPLDRSCSPDSFENNVRAEIAAGKSREQAVAIASKLRDECDSKSDAATVHAALAKATGSKHRKARSSEYLEAILEEMRDKLPAWMVAMLHKLALPKAGGRTRSRMRTLAAAAKAAGNPSLKSACTPDQWRVASAELERMGLTWKQRSFDPPADVREAAERGLELRREYGRGGTEVGVARARDLSNGRPVSADTIRRMTSFFARHQDNRGWGDADAPSNGHIAWLLWGGDAGREWAERISESIDEKSLSEGLVGPHAHGLNRTARQTHEDGAHSHVFLLPESAGALVYTMEDGEHVHAISEDQLIAGGGAHTHKVVLGDQELVTEAGGGEHAHEVLVSSTGYGGMHRHRLRLPDGTVIESMTTAEVAEFFGESPSAPMPPASELAYALDRAAELEALADAHRLFEPFDPSHALEQLASGASPERPTVAMEVIGKSIDGVIDAAFSDDDVGAQLELPPGLEVEEGDLVEVLGSAVVGKSQRLFAMTCAEAMRVAEQAALIDRMSRRVAWSGPEHGAKAVFVAAAPNSLEAARQQGIVGLDAKTFEDKYLAPLGVSRAEVLVGFAAPHWVPDPVDTAKLAPWLKSLDETLEKHKGAPVIALGKAAKELLGDRSKLWVPHPAVVRKSGDTSQVDRKLRRVKLAPRVASGDKSSGRGEVKPGVLADAEAGSGHKVAFKADRPEEQIVYGVVLDPNAIDAHDDWAPPLEIQRTAHEYLHQSRVVGLEHAKRVQARVVESFVEQYPTKADYEAAVAMRPHKVTRRPFGDDHLMSGAWVIGVKLEDREWQEYKAGRITGFSMGGFSRKSDITPEQMPAIEVIDLVPSAP